MPSNFVNGLNNLTSEVCCKRSLNTFESCKGELRGKSILDGKEFQELSISKTCMYNMILLNYVLNVFYNQVHSKHSSLSKSDRKENIIKRSNNQIIKERDVYLFDDNEIYKLNEDRLRISENQGGTHASPAEHERRSHQRRLKSGEFVTVKQCTINKGVEQKIKPKYIITTRKNKSDIITT